MMASGLMKWFYTVCYLRPVQIYGRIWRMLYRPAVDYSSSPSVCSSAGAWILPARRKPSLLSPVVFRFLNEERALVNSQDWDDPAASKLWRYNLHYFDDLNAEDCESRIVWHRDLLTRWINENPPGVGTGWEPYPTSVRIVNWLKWALAGNEMPPECLHSLAIQVRWLCCRLETHLLGNHLFANAKALVFAGLFFRGAEAEGWLKKGLDILVREVPEQVLADGGQFERSTMYHAIALEDMLDLCNIAVAYPCAVSTRHRFFVDGLPLLAERMGYWLAVMCHPDREIGFFNDAAMGIAPSPSALEGYAARLGIPRFAKTVSGVTHLKESGYVRLQQATAVVLLDVALVGPDYLPGHAHADTLSFELSLFGQRLLVNSGTSCYGTGEERLRQRGTAAHNTVVVDEQNSSEVWSGFRVARRARPTIPIICEQAPRISVEAIHDGYRRLAGTNIHRRKWLSNNHVLVVEDEVSGSFRNAEARFHLHPDVMVVKQLLSENRVVLQLPGGQDVDFFVDGGLLKVEKSTWHPRFGVSESSFCLVAKFRDATLKTTINWGGSV